MRLFVALDVDDVAREALGALRMRLARRLDSGRGGLRWTQPEHLHLTLAFIGEVPDADATPIAEALTPAMTLAPYALVFGGLGVFPPRGGPRVLWIGATRGARETIELQRRVAERLVGIGVALEQRPFHAHLTLGRWRDAAERDRRAVVEVADTGEIARVDVDHVTLYQSRLSPSGSTYTPLVVTPLRPAKAAPG